MSQSQRFTRLSSDFSIERILAVDREKKFHASIDIAKEFSSTIDEKLNDARDLTSSVLGIDDNTTRLELLNEHGKTMNSGEKKFLPPYPGISCARTVVSSCRAVADEMSTGNVNGNQELAWLQCTRYRPPKLPRKSSIRRTGKSRRPGAHPRIPFTAQQLEILEDKYRATAYLSRRDVLQLSTILRLPQSRVKIWFQNRRARDRRETGISGSNITIITNDESSMRESLESSNENFPSTNPS